ncbi:MAG: glycosyltransferase [Dysgonamonadaceae bacterium]|jgi:glycosyltransferase involved in cell wall biosynthesis|nr:glycosyltransferase [Dysgonamonadaceae bacterium]
MNTSPKVSVIIPIYNAESYLKTCIESVLSQTFTNFELLLINDGSTDNSKQICEEYASKDKRIQVISKENGGVSNTRNVGLEKARGHWINFIDSDDQVNESYLENLYNETTSDDNVLILQGINYYNDKLEKTEQLPNITLKENAISQAFQTLKIYNFGYPFSKLYNRAVIEKNHLRFNENISFWEDLLFMCEYIYQINTIKFIEGANYNYFLKKTGLTYSYQNYQSEYALYKEYVKILDKIFLKTEASKDDMTELYDTVSKVLFRTAQRMYDKRNQLTKKERLKNLRVIFNDENIILIKKFNRPESLIAKIKMKLAVSKFFSLFDLLWIIKTALNR